MRTKWHLIAVAAVFATGCAQNDKQKEVKLTEVPVIKLALADTIFQQDYVADIQSVKNVEIRARIDGYLDRIYVDEGTHVKKGQLLFQISNQELYNERDKATASLQSARAAVNIAELEMDRIKVLCDKKVIAPSELKLAAARVSDAKARAAEAEAVLADAQTKIDYLSVRSPFNGVIDRLPMKAGSLIADGSLLTTLSDNQEMYAYFDVSENEYLQHKINTSNRLKQNKPVSLVLSDGSLYTQQGLIETHEAEFSDNTGSIAFRAKFPNSQSILKHGASGKIRLQSQLHSKLLVPQKAVLEIQDKSFVFVVSPDNTVKMQSFTPELRIAEYFIVEEGLKPGDAIVIEGVQSIREGEKVEPRYQTILVAQK